MNGALPYPNHPTLRGIDWRKAIPFLFASNAAILFVIWFGHRVWPEGLPVNTQNLFWLASGVNIAGVLLLGFRYGFLLLFNALPAYLLTRDHLDLNLLGALANVGEALLALWIIRKPGRFTRRFDRIRPVVALVGASLAAPLVNTLVMPSYFCLKGFYTWSECLRAMGTWNFSNGGAILLLTPLIVAIARRDWNFRGRVAELILALLACAGFSWLAFNATLSGAGMNLAFLAFPPVIFVAIRFGIGETTLALAINLVLIYWLFFIHGQNHPLESVPTLIWFIQAMTWVLAATGLLVAALSAERHRAEHRSLQATLAAEQARLAALRYQINPHFLFNTLNSIRATTPHTGTVTREMITDLADYLRNTLDQGENDFIPLSEEIRNVREYLRIEEHRFGPVLQTGFDIDAGAEDRPVPAFLLQPLAENAIRHGLEKTSGPCRITLSAHYREGRLRLSIVNSGRWQEPQRRKGTGLENVQRRLELLYGKASRLEIIKGEDTVGIEIEFPA